MIIILKDRQGIYFRKSKERKKDKEEDAINFIIIDKFNAYLIKKREKFIFRRVNQHLRNL
jgi:hypothetical protein